LVDKVKAVMVREQTPATGCVATHGLTLAQAAALRLHTPWPLKVLDVPSDDIRCDLLIATPQAMMFWTPEHEQIWKSVQTLRRPSDNNEEIVILKRRSH
jgi:hypothetical protein